MPDRILQTERLTVRAFKLEDADFVLQLLNDPEFLEHIGDRGVRDLEGARDYLRKGPLAGYERDGFSLWRVSLTAGDVPVGTAGLIRREALEHVDLGYALMPEFRGKGLAREVAAAVLAYAREALGLETVVAIVSSGNERSIRLLNRLGFRYDRDVRLSEDSGPLQLFCCSPPVVAPDGPPPE